MISRDGSEHRVLGGSASYISSILSAFGVPFRALAKVGEDFRYREQLSFEPILEGKKSTSFIDDYRSGERRETLEAPGPRIFPRDLERVFSKPGERVRIAIVCAVAGEVLPETLRALRPRADLVLADAQALARAFDADGAVRALPIERTVYANALGAIDWLKLGANELGCVDPAHLPGNLLITEGPQGARVLHAPDAAGRREEHRIEPFAAREIDATGAGDCFLAGFAYGLLQGLRPQAAARIGSYCGARAVEAVGVPAIDAQALELLVQLERSEAGA